MFCCYMQVDAARGAAEAAGQPWKGDPVMGVFVLHNKRVAKAADLPADITEGRCVVMHGIFVAAAGERAYFSVPHTRPQPSVMPWSCPGADALARVSYGIIAPEVHMCTKNISAAVESPCIVSS